MYGKVFDGPEARLKTWRLESETGAANTPSRQSYALIKLSLLPLSQAFRGGREA